VSPAPERPRRVNRFTTAERRVHRATGALTRVATAACPYVPALAELVGRRHPIVAVHQWSGVLPPPPVPLGLACPAVRADPRRPNRLAPYDRTRPRAPRARRTGPRHRPAGKFNAGQKTCTGWTAGAAPVTPGTGPLTWFTHPPPQVPRAGAILVHDRPALTVVLALAGHIRAAPRDPEARRGTRAGHVDPNRARREHPRWMEEDR
jgi:formate dehydrogenase subunit gamma